jgi:nucleoporin NUP42
LYGRKLQYEQNALANAEQIFASARNDIKGAFETAKRQSLGTDSPSNTSAIPGPGSGSAFGAGGVSAFGNPSGFGVQNSVSTSPFGQPQGAFGASAFGAPAFGQPSVPKSNFGGAPMNSGGFSAFAGPGPSAFATAASNPPNASTGSVFGQSAFSDTNGGVQQPQSAIGAVNSAPTGSAFGRPSAFGSTSGSVFGQPSAFGTTGSPTSAFGQPTSTSAFGHTSTASSNPLTTPFGQPAATPSAFSHPTSAFGQPPAAASAFSQPAATTSAFGQQTAYTSPFGVAAQQPTSGQAASPSKSSAAPNSQANAPDFSNAKSTYKPGLNPYDALLPANYSSLLPDSVRAAFAAPRFSWDNVPDWIPPLDMR